MFKGFLSKWINDALQLTETNHAYSSFIPEPTRSFLFITDADVSNIEVAGSMRIVISIGSDGVTTNFDHHTNLNAEPSMIWTKLKVAKNNKLEESPMYYPAYSTLSPEQRYQYLMWLQDVTQPTNLSYVFLYYYGLERHLLLGDFYKSADEIIRLLNFHDKGSFRSYAETALMTAMIYRKKFDFLHEKDFVFQNISNEWLMIRKKLQASLTTEQLMSISSRVGFRNRNYIKKVPTEFAKVLESLVLKYELENDLILNCIEDSDLEFYESNCFGNLSIPNEVRSVKVPDILRNEKFKAIVCSLLQDAHDTIKAQKMGKKSKS